MLSRLDAIRNIRNGQGIQLSFVGSEEVNGRPHNFNVILRYDKSSNVVAIIESVVMCTSYHIPLNSAQVLSFIKRHYARNVL